MMRALNDVYSRSSKAEKPSAYDEVDSAPAAVDLRFEEPSNLQTCKFANLKLDIEFSEICNVRPHFQCEELWLGKRHIARTSKVQGLPKLAAYSLSLMDGKRTAPEYWRNLDPYWSGSGPVMRRYFHPDGSVTAGPGDRVWGGHESSYTVVTGLLADGKIRDHYVRINRWPKLNVQRRDDWGWELCNHLYTYTSVADADDKEEDGTGPFFPLF
ncbi:hypothetical protein BUALT_Bualt12G0103600 [Buddleja alternifolia]|uniref:Uncharacterized protein n=1 Tax=Buddleja alternifolia TaxID=168488 RepID=A0AAV6X0L1_9LAMI|nr:hypothetical protein BUALT_Bualt12G0103600 [Buddleja alternifolia]